MKIMILYATAGHGHKKAAEYLAEEFERHKGQRPDLKIINMDFLDKTPAHFRKMYPASYEFMVTKISWLWGIAFAFTDIQPVARYLVAPLRRLFNKINSFALEKYLIAENPDVLMFTHFFPPEVCTKLKKKGKITSTLVTVVTDFLPHSTWINPGTDYFIVMTDEAEAVLKRWGVVEDRIRVFGIPVARKFELKGEKQPMRRQLGIAEDKFTVLLTSGAFGMGPFEALIENLLSFREKLQLIVVCGNNKALYERLTARKSEIPGKIFGFVNNMDELMEAADLIVSKSGGLTTCESLAKVLPMVVTKPIPGQEAGNAQYLESRNCCYRLKDPSDITKIVEDIFALGEPLKVVNNPQSLEEKRRNIRKIRRPRATEDIVNFVLSLKTGK